MSFPIQGSAHSAASAGQMARAQVAAQSASQGDATSSSATAQTITSADFMTLLVTEMKNQDPTQPTDPTQYVQQLVQVNTDQPGRELTQAFGVSSTHAANHLRSTERVPLMPNFSIALTGLEANSVALNTIGNNLANLNTTAYKEQQTNFADLYYQTIGSTNIASQMQVGTGTRVASIDTNFKQGTPNTTGANTDMAINGDGFFVVQKNGEQQLTRAGNFKLDNAGHLVTTDGLSVMGYPVSNGAVNPNASIVPLSVPAGKTQLPQATTEFSFTQNLNASATVGTGATASQLIYDSLGTSHVATVAFTKTGANQWSYSISLPPGDSTGASSNASGMLSFNSNGTLASPTSNVASIKFPGMANNSADLNFQWDLYDSNGGALLTQTNAASSSNATTQNGYSSGTYQDFSVDTQGVITASYSNGKTDVLGQVALATVTNQSGLSRTGNNIYRTTPSSGLLAVGTPNSGGRGLIAGSSLEGSNVDISTEFANLIVAQRAFEANSKTVTAFDTVTQDTISMIR